MSFQWPLALLALLAVPLLWLAYWRNLRKRRKQAIVFSNVAMLRSIAPKRSRLKRHAPVALMLTCMGLLGFASARPHAVRPVPFDRTSIILALDVSRSMCSTDVRPNRMAAAQEAARSFIEQQPKGSRMGLVIFSGFAQLAVPPTSDREALLKSVDGLTTGRGTAIGAAMLKSIDAIAEINADVLPVGDVTSASSAPTATLGDGFVPDIVVLLTDGANTRGVAPLDAVPYAIDRKVRVYTIGFGTTSPGTLSCSAAQLGGDALGGFGGPGGGGPGGPGGGGPGGPGGGGGRFLSADEPTLMKVAERTGGEYYKAEDAAALRKVFADLPKDVERQKERREITTIFAALAAILAVAAIVASIRWSPYP